LAVMLVQIIGRANTDMLRCQTRAHTPDTAREVAKKHPAPCDATPSRANVEAAIMLLGTYWLISFGPEPENKRRADFDH
jgi:hypothetical protein